MDVTRCYSVVTRVGKQWLTVLRHQGRGELADIVVMVNMMVTVVEKGTCLEIDHTNEDNSTANNHVLPFTALCALYRQPPVCD